MFFKKARRGLAIELTPHRILVAGLVAWDDRPLVIDSMAEFGIDDRDSLRHWLQAKHDRSFVPAFCSFLPPDWQLIRESIFPRRLSEPTYLSELARDRLKLVEPAQWQLHLLHPLEGQLVEPTGSQRPVLISAVSHAAVRDTQQILLDLGIMPARLEVGLLPTLGAILNYNEKRSDTRACVLLNLGAEETTAWILGKEGVHTPPPIKYGYSTLARGAMKEFELADETEARARLISVDDEVTHRAPRLVKPLVRELKPLIDSYELTTGQRVGGLLCHALPSWLNWINSPLAAATGLESFSIDCNQWLQTVNLRTEGDLFFTPKWFSLLALIAEIDQLQSNGQP